MDFVKIKINLPEKVYAILANDMEAFGFIKRNGEVNKNGFINDLINAYYPIFSKTEQDVISRVSGQVNIREEDFPLISSIFFEERFKKEGNYTKDLQFIISKDNESIYEEIFAISLRNRSISQYFREMFILYTSYPQDKREQIVFGSKISKAKHISEHNKKALVYFKDGSKKVINIYDVVPTREEFYNYVIGVEENGAERTVISYHVFNIKNIIELNEEKDLNKDEIEKLELMLFQCPEFAINKVDDITVELTPTGEKLFKLWIHTRPKPYSVEGNIYKFKGGYYHLLIYFFKFANEAKILSPNDTKEFFASRFKLAYENYKK